MSSITVGLLRQDELAAADQIMRLAFGTFLGLPEPSAFMGDADYVRTRWAATRLRRSAPGWMAS